MSAVGTEGWLAAAIVAVYLLDSLALLAIDEALLLARAGGGVRVVFGADFELGGRRPHLPNPLLPGQAEFRIRFDALAAAAVSDQWPATVDARVRASQALRWLSASCAGLTVLVAPVALLLHQDAAFVLAIGATLLLTLLAAGVAGRQRAALGLGVGAIVVSTLLALICVPCAGNLARALLRQSGWTLSTSALLALQPPGAGARAARLAIRGALQRRQRLEAETSASFGRIGAQLCELQREEPPA